MNELRRLHALSQHLEETGDYETAELTLRKVLTLMQHDNRADQEVADVLYDLGLLNFALDKYGEAISCFIQALDIRLEHLRHDDARVKEVFEMLSMVNAEQAERVIPTRFHALATA